MKFLLHLIISGLAVFATAAILPGVSIDNFLTATIVAIVLGLINAILRPILVLLTLPITIVTLGIFLLILNGLLVLLTAKLVEGFVVAGILSGILFSVIMALISWFLYAMEKEVSKK